jgi:hypothetical protein
MATANYGNAQLANANENAELDLNQMLLDLAKLALKLKKQQQQNAAEGEVDKKHEGVSCDVCGLESFRGYRYISNKKSEKATTKIRNLRKLFCFVLVK